MSGLNPETKTVVLKAPHRHQGRDYPVGAKLPLPTARADWLIGLDRAEAAPADKKPTKE